MKSNIMKKILLSILASILFLFSHSQVSNLKFTYEKEKTGYANQVSDNLRQSAPFWSEDFQSGIPTSWTNSTAPWAYRGPGIPPGAGVGSQGAYASNSTPIASPTANNGFIIFDSDYYDNNGVAGAFGTGMYPCPHIGDLRTDMIDMSSYSDVTLKMNSYYRTFAGQAFVDFYVNGNFNSRVQVHSDIATNDATFTDQVALVRVPFSVVGNSNVQLSFVFEGTSNVINAFSGYYFWMIDDLELMETPSFLLETVDANHGGWEVGYATTTGFGIDYTFKPLTQSAANPYMFELKVANAGAKNLNGIKMNVSINNAIGSQVFSSSSDTTTLVILDTATYLANQTYDPATIGVYDISYWATSDSVLSSDTIQMQTVITDSVYGRDYGSPDGNWRVARDCGGLQLLNIFDIYSNEQVSSASAHIADYSRPGTPVYAVLYEVDTTQSPWAFIQLAQTDDYNLQAQDIDNWINLAFKPAYNIFPGPHAIAIGGYAHPLDTFGVSTSGDAEILMSRIQDNGCNLGTQAFGYWYYISTTPMIRMNFGSTWPSAVSLEKNKNLRIFPNPAQNSLNIELLDPSLGEIVLEIFDISGKLVLNERIENCQIKTIDVSHIDKGNYMLSLKNKNFSTKTKITIK